MDHYISKLIIMFSLILSCSMPQTGAEDDGGDFSNQMKELIKKNKQMINDLLNDQQMEQFNKKLQEVIKDISQGNKGVKGNKGTLLDLEDSLTEESMEYKDVFWANIDAEYILKIMALGTKEKPLDIKIEQSKITVKLDTSSIKQSSGQKSLPQKEEIITHVLFVPGDADAATAKVEILSDETWVHFKKI